MTLVLTLLDAPLHQHNSLHPLLGLGHSLGPSPRGDLAFVQLVNLSCGSAMSKLDEIVLFLSDWSTYPEVSGT